MFIGWIWKKEGFLIHFKQRPRLLMFATSIPSINCLFAVPKKEKSKHGILVPEIELEFLIALCTLWHQTHSTQIDTWYL